MRKLILFTIFVVSIKTSVLAGITDSLSIGMGGGINNYNTYKGEIYLKSDLSLPNRKYELKAGFNNRTYELSFDGVSDLKAYSVGIFADAAIYPFYNGFLAGVRWELVNFNWLTEASKNRIELENNYTPTNLYTGTCVFLQLGYNFKLTEDLGLKVYGQPGMQQFTISNGTSSSGSFVETTGDMDDIVLEYHYEFIFNLNVSFEFRVK